MERTHTMSLPERVGVVGGGRMGAGIAHAFLISGAAVTVIESSVESATAARERIRSSMAKAEERGTLAAPVEEALTALAVSTTIEDLSGCGLLVEAVPEDMAVKQQVLTTVEGLGDAGVWLGTNTSSLSVDILASALQRPDRLIGLHFFNPVPASELVEIVVGARTSKQLVELAQGWVAELGKTAITVRDSPGFASSRLGVAIALEAMRMLQERVASAADIDTAMTLGYRHPRRSAAHHRHRRARRAPRRRRAPGPRAR